MCLVAIAGCSGANSAKADHDTPTAVDRARVVDSRDVRVRAIPGGGGITEPAALTESALLPPTYREAEYVVSGHASLYRGSATGPVTVESRGHPYTTRIVVRSPRAPEHFSGRVWIEPFNTSAGSDLGAVWGQVAAVLTANGDAWVGVTVRSNQVGVLQKFDAVRYEGLKLAKNGYVWDILREVGAVVKEKVAGTPLRGMSVRHVYMGGYSQSAVDVATFAAAFNSRTRTPEGASVYDGYLLGAHDSNLSPLQSGNSIIPAFESIRMPAVDVPVLDFEPQTDVEGFAVTVPTMLLKQAGVAGADKITTKTYTYTDTGGAFVRRSNANTSHDRYQLVEIPGAPHVTGGTDACVGTSSFPTSAFFRAAASNLTRWVERGVQPPRAPRIELATLARVSVAETDRDGNAVGGVRSPYLDVPLSRFVAHSGPGPTCKQFGRETSLTGPALRARYGTANRYMGAFTTSFDRSIRARTLLASDRAALVAAQQRRAMTLFAST